MARKAKRGGGGGGGRGGRRGAREPTASGIEKYGADEVDEYLGLNDEEASEADGSSGMVEEEVFAPEDEGWDDEEDTSFKKSLKKKGKKGKDDDEEEWEGEDSALKEAAALGSVGWRGQDFHGGEDAGADSSDGGSDEELNFEEARRLEELRAQRLGGVEDPMAVLLGGLQAGAAEEPADAGQADAGAAAAPAAANAKFEALFEADAEKSSVRKDLTQLSEGKKKSLAKQEAPEMVPLLEDFKAKLLALQEIAPLVTPQALERLPKSGAKYLRAKAGLLLSTLANLSFYVLLRAEGGDVRTHPVVSQLVWLKELFDKVAPVDAKLRPKLKKTVKALKKVERAEAQAKAEAQEAAAARAEAPASGEAGAGGKAKAKLSLKEKLERLRAAEPPPKPASGAGAARAAEPRTEDLLRLPGRKKKGGVRGAPADLDEADPLVGHWMPQGSLGEQLTSVRQYLSEGRKAKVATGDQDVEARPRRARERVREEPLPEASADRRPPGIAKGGELFEESGGEDEMIKTAKAVAKRKKEQKTEREVQREKERIMRQNVPEELVEGRRKTSKKILQNRGLVRRRKKEAGNARVANRKKYEKKLKRRKGAVQEMREGAADGATYEGEATGVRTHVRKSMRLG